MTGDNNGNKEVATSPNVSPSGRQLPIIHNDMEEDIVDKIGNSLDGGYGGLRQKVESALRPTSNLNISLPLSQKVDAITQKEIEPTIQEEKPSNDNRRVYNGYDDIIAENEETPEQKKKREKRERLGKIFAAVGDGVAALSDLFFATKGTPSSYNPDTSVYKKVQTREDYLRKEKFDNDMNLLNSKIRLKELNERLRRQDAQDRYNQNRLDFYNKQEERRQRELDYKQFKAENDAAFKDSTIELKREYNQIQRDLADGRITLMQANARLADARTRHENVKANKENQGTTTTYEYETDAMGNKKVKSKTVAPANSKGRNSNTPPSRTTNTGNTPPSRRK